MISYPNSLSQFISPVTRLSTFYSNSLITKTLEIKNKQKYHIFLFLFSLPCILFLEGDMAEVKQRSSPRRTGVLTGSAIDYEIPHDFQLDLKDWTEGGKIIIMAVPLWTSTLWTKNSISTKLDDFVSYSNMHETTHTFLPIPQLSFSGPRRIGCCSLITRFANDATNDCDQKKLQDLCF